MKRIEVKNICFGYTRAQDIFHNLTLQMESDLDGKVTAIMGPSGAGKSTLLHLLMGIEKPRKGDIVLYPNDPVVAYVPQDPVLFEHLSIKQNGRYFEFAGANRKHFNKTLYHELVNELGLSNIIERPVPVNRLSGGQKQRLSLLRALSINPDFILLDEPCNGLDAEVKTQFLSKLRRITTQFGFFVLYVTHHKLEAQLVADDVVYLEQGKPGGVIQNAIKAPIGDFLARPPILDAAHIFRFPDAKILAIIKDKNGNVEIAVNKSQATHFWLVNDASVTFSSMKGWPFTVVSRSPMFCVLRHHASDTEWMFPTAALNNYSVDDEVRIELSGGNIEYDSNGRLIGTT